MPKKKTRIKVWQEGSGWAYIAGRQYATVKGWHIDKSEAIRLAEAYERRCEEGLLTGAAAEMSARRLARLRQCDDALSLLPFDDE
jgi:hypothetical protein